MFSRINDLYRRRQFYQRCYVSLCCQQTRSLWVGGEGQSMQGLQLRRVHKDTRINSRGCREEHTEKAYGQRSKFSATSLPGEAAKVHEFSFSNNWGESEWKPLIYEGNLPASSQREPEFMAPRKLSGCNFPLKFDSTQRRNCRFYLRGFYQEFMPPPNATCSQKKKKKDHSNVNLIKIKIPTRNLWFLEDQSHWLWWPPTFL